ncbi:MAG TPA: DUF4412 domain-containing protein [Candidatus Sulfotelmatobacter sp.]|nr:DUF4412 domain-containing protein [Candidatus Sulfotelmatobacter sp.]
MKTKSLLCAIHIAGIAAILSASATALVAQDFTIHMKMGGGAEGTTYYVSANAIRRTTPGGNDVIDRIDRGMIIYLDHGNKVYKEVPAAEAREKIASAFGNMDAQKKAMLHQMGMDAPAQLTKIGPGEIIAGYPTDKYSLKTGMAQVELWITQSLQFPAGYYRDFSLMSGVAGPVGDSGKVAEAHGVVLKRSMTAMMGRNMSAGGTASATETAALVEEKPIPASMFEPPTGYQKATSEKGRN